MRECRYSLPAAVALTLLCLSAGAADEPPKLDVESTCKSSATAGVNGTASEEGCLRSEYAARDGAAKRWGDFTPAAKRQCEKQFEAGGYPSYVELLTCLELASGVAPNQPPGQGGSSGSAGSATIEPSPNQRTNPIEVLGKPVR